VGDLPGIQSCIFEEELSNPFGVSYGSGEVVETLCSKIFGANVGYDERRKYLGLRLSDRSDILRMSTSPKSISAKYRP